MPKLTELQQDVLDYIRQFIIANRFSPTVAEIALKFHWASRTAAVNHVNALVKKGRIRKLPINGRNIELV